ncbi:hypothetical protein PAPPERLAPAPP_03560 [Brevundimonas phage vB_BpoS-Papperlapapp]|nr:hypothetical protein PAPPERLAPAPP_03560 [Brevundimonas phage vB_BpoS-Papperlapapp]
MTTGTIRPVDLNALLAQEIAAQSIMSAFAAYAREIGCVVGEGAMADCIEATPAQGALLSAEWAALTEVRNVV